MQVLLHGRSRDTKVLAVAREIWLVVANKDILLTPQAEPVDKSGYMCLIEWAVPATLLDLLG